MNARALFERHFRLSEVLRPKMQQCNEDAGASRMRCAVLQKSIGELCEARAKAAQEADLL